VNLDMPVLLYDFTDVIAFGAQHSSLQQVLETTLARADLTLTADPIPEQALFTRSDHYNFVRRGVPSIFLMTGWNTPAGAGEGGKVFMDFLSTHYHRPSDDLTRPIDYDAGARFAYVNYLIAREIANAAGRPRWNDGDFFGELFGATR
jgi:Zn-dependent M28 family amino/carboxypeptidase